MVKSTGSEEPLLLAIDISNTGIKFGLYPRVEPTGCALAHRHRPREDGGRVRHAAERTVRHAGLRLEAIADAISPVSCLRSRRFFRTWPRSISAARRSSSPITDLGIRLLVDNPWETGADRMLSALAVHRSMAGRHRDPVRHGHHFDCVSPRAISWAAPSRRAWASPPRRWRGPPRGSTRWSCAAAARHRQEHHPRHAVRHRLRACRTGGGLWWRGCAKSCPGRARARHRPRRPRRHDGPRHVQHRRGGSPFNSTWVAGDL